MSDDHDAVIERLNEIKAEGGPASIHQAILNDEITILDQPDAEN